MPVKENEDDLIFQSQKEIDGRGNEKKCAPTEIEKSSGE